MQSPPDIFFRNVDCRALNYYLCELNEHTAFYEPPEGNYVIFDTVFSIYELTLKFESHNISPV